MQMDVREAAEHAAARQLAMQRANKMLHDDGDRVRALHRCMLQSEVMAQNDAQLRLKERAAASCKAQEAAFVQRQRRALEVRGDDATRARASDDLPCAIAGCVPTWRECRPRHRPPMHRMLANCRSKSRRSWPDWRRTRGS